jgi:hypothetical protein
MCVLCLARRSEHMSAPHIVLVAGSEFIILLYVPRSGRAGLGNCNPADLKRHETH